ncbi:tRNA-specific adenosine deaminase [Legionella busanensis]|uniref:tRNA-specific adenosine deaminase n=1 Tax=Legionella busanensis TaxID=190655 RepID=A0A378JNP1_9GAMM|nr:tRNA adenosine(34) deaminase TadA [Legionella busanensis]STX51819.1 tRNA-specific adenosine deaminase [Legionella busanensis]
MGINQDKHWMREAYLQALKAYKLHEVPIGAIVVVDNQLIAHGHNRTITDKDPCAHAEICALRAAAMHLGNHRLTQATLYVTLEPCVMCAGAMVQARIKRVVFATRDFKAGAAGSVYNLLQGYPLNHQIQIDEGVLEKECSVLLSDFFKLRR